MSLKRSVLALEAVSMSGAVLALEEFGEPLDEMSQEIAVQETEADQAEIAAELSNVEQLEDKAAALEEAAVMMDESVTEATPGEVLMTEAIAELATAGTPVDPDEVTGHGAEVEGEQPAMEHFTGKRLSMEAAGFRETARKFWDWIKEIIAKVWKKIKSFFTNIFGTLARTVKAAEALRKRANDTAGKVQKEAKTKLGSEANVLAVDGKAPKNFSEIDGTLTQVATYTTFFYETYAKKLEDLGNGAVEIINGVDINNLTASYERLTGRIATMFDPKSFTKFFSASKDSRFGKNSYMSQPLPSNLSIVLQAAEDGQAVSSEGFSFHMTSAKEHETIRDAEIATMSPNDCVKISDVVMEICSTIKKFDKAGHQDKIAKVADKLKAASEKSKAKLEKVKEEDITFGQQQLWRSLVRFNSMYARMSAEPHVRLASLAVSVCKAAMVAGNKSLSNYGVTKD